MSYCPLGALVWDSRSDLSCYGISPPFFTRNGKTDKWINPIGNFKERPAFTRRSWGPVFFVLQIQQKGRPHYERKHQNSPGRIFWKEVKTSRRQRICLPICLSPCRSLWPPLSWFPEASSLAMGISNIYGSIRAISFVDWLCDISLSKLRGVLQIWKQTE